MLFLHKRREMYFLAKGLDKFGIANEWKMECLYFTNCFPRKIESLC